ncbi:outer membrane beta-barrel protein [Pontibacter burrus]|uniref:Autotransporter outer membrane beta-barrel domain-containing protein n=1 Tax=Pontibacter burrus TaxID=2704466 RepID=A0A6B3LVV0_9BACT|nr:outer membrane beta-barrel protein [Pontibacter burrus]NEM97561.1 autotransporter outer membrane beta-barrel domain-containing protein [Pontibacter burrus]
MKVFFTAICCLLTFAAAAQKNFVRGYYITATGDTVQSYIDDRNWIKNPDQIRIADSPGSSTFTTLSASDIKGFGLSTGDVFVSEVVQIDKSKENLNQMNIGDAPIVVTDTVFLRVLVKGKLNLLFVEDENSKKHFYLQKENAQPEELVIHKKVMMVNGKKVISSTPAYKDLLNRHLQDCPEAARRISTTQLQTGMLTKLFTNYNACFASADEKQYVAKSEKIIYKLGAVAGLSPSSLIVQELEEKYSLNNNGLANSYTIGLSLNAVLPRASRRWSVYNEVAWKYFQMTGEHESRSGIGQYKHETFDVKMGYIGLNTMLRYQLPLATIRPYVTVGIANNFNLIDESTVETFSRSFTIEKTTNGPFMTPTRKYEQALLIGAGVETGKFNAGLRLEYGNGMSSFSTVRTIRSTFNILLGYSFN